MIKWRGRCQAAQVFIRCWAFSVSANEFFATEVVQGRVSTRHPHLPNMASVAQLEVFARGVARYRDNQADVHLVLCTNNNRKVTNVAVEMLHAVLAVWRDAGAAISSNRPCAVGNQTYTV